jgi:hypothetical protein
VGPVAAAKPPFNCDSVAIILETPFSIVNEASRMWAGDPAPRLFGEKPVCYKYRQSSRGHERIE